jgi:CRP-like cAMP-binding protein
MPCSARSSAGRAHVVARNAEIYGEEEPADYLYKVVSGAVRICKLLDDGRRQITAFHLPGEIFGLEVGDEHRFTAEAVTESSILI